MITKNRCKKHREDLIAYMDGELSEKQARRVELHLEECPGCSAELAQMKTAMESLSLWDAVEPSADFDRVFQRKLNAVRIDEPETRKWAGLYDLFKTLVTPRFTLAATAVCAAVIVMVSVFTAGIRTDIPQDQLHIATDMELFLDLEIIENSEALENFDVITFLDVLEQETNG